MPALQKALLTAGNAVSPSGRKLSADRVSDAVESLSLEEAAIGEAAAAIAEADLASALPQAAAQERQACGLGYIEEGYLQEAGKLDTSEAVQDLQHPASSSWAIDKPAPVYDGLLVPAEIGIDANSSGRLQQLAAEGALEAADPVSDRLEALAVVQDRLPSTGDKPITSGKTKINLSVYQQVERPVIHC